jgi:SAM-dependent methyltransferase
MIVALKDKYLPKGGGSQYFRERRFKLFQTLLNELPRPIRILDIGGTQFFWEKMNFTNEPNVRFTLINLYPQEAPSENFECVIGDATNLPFQDKQFDIVFSNSVIEHLFTWENQVKMANEIRRVGKNYFIQTPNLYFPIEPHWLFPFFQFLPIFVRVFLTRHFNIGGYPKTNNQVEAVKRVKEVRLLSIREMQKLFPEGQCYKEKFMSLTKSIVMYSFPHRK